MTTDDLLKIIGIKEATLMETSTRIDAQEKQIIELTEQIKELKKKKGKKNGN